MLKRTSIQLAWAVGVIGLIMSAGACTSPETLGEFEGSVDVGEVMLPGRVDFDSGTATYEISGSGDNMWGTTDGFHFVWKKVPGDLELTARVAFGESAGHEHRKAGLMVRDNLAADAAYADAVVHADGLISLQYRTTAGGPTEEIQSALRAPAVLKLDRTGDLFSLYVKPDGGEFEPVGSVLVELSQTPHVGLVVCSHDAKELVSALFTEVGINAREIPQGVEREVESTLEIINVDTGRRRIVYRAVDHFEAPNWSRDGSYLLFNRRGEIFRMPVSGGTPEVIDTGHARQCNNDHGLSPDGEWLAISHHEDGPSLIYVLPASGGTPRLVTKTGPSYWHGWSPDGKTLAYCAERNGEYDIYTIPVNGGRETRLTTAEGLDDGPDYSPDGKWIYINSVRSGLMKIWRISPDGEVQEQVTMDEDYADWFAHPSPDGQSLVFVSYDDSVEGHPPNKEVALRLMPAEGGEPRVIARLFGGQGTINVPSWSPDSKEVAFVSYRLVLPPEAP